MYHPSWLTPSTQASSADDKSNMLDRGGGGGGALVFEIGYHLRKKIHVIRVVFQDQAMYVHHLGVQKHAKLEKRVCFWSYWQILEQTRRAN